VKLADAIATAPRRKLTGTYWHQGPTRHQLRSCADPARGPGRYHRTGEPGVWYASNQEQGAWAELFRHFTDEGVDPFEVRRRVGRVSVALQVLDLTAAALLGGETRAVFVRALSHVAAERSEIRQPPPRLADLLPVIRPHERVADSVRRLLETLAQAGAEAIRRRRR
jgi:hypothetical protein